MIGSLTGLVAHRDADRCLLEVHGVGYVVLISARTLAALPASATDAVRLLIETQMREDAITLFGFLDAAERDWFRVLITVQGVGGRVALAILSALPPTELSRVIGAEDRTALTRAPGVGAKLAARLVTELRGKIPATTPVASSAVAAGVSVSTSGMGDVLGDAVSALINLGYRPPEAQRAAAMARETLGGQAALGEIIRTALQDLATR
jgi:Holliday junction DNA helicase RuvA